MTTYNNCPNCTCNEEKIEIFKCVDCGKVFCSECAFVLDYRLCPSCHSEAVMPRGYIDRSKL